MDSPSALAAREDVETDTLDVADMPVHKLSRDDLGDAALNTELDVARKRLLKRLLDSDLVSPFGSSI